MEFNSFLLATSIVALAEIGDKTQLLSLMLAARYKTHHWAIIAGIFAATILNHAVAAWFGSAVAQWLSPDVLRWILGGGFIALGLWLLIPDKLAMKKPLQRTIHGKFLRLQALYFSLLKWAIKLKLPRLH